MELPPFKLENWFAKYEFNAPHLLCCSDCETVNIKELLALTGDEAAEDKLLNLGLGYTECNGAPPLRAAICECCYTTISPDDVLVHVGAEEAIFTFAMQFGKGDHFVVLAPAYQSLYSVAQARGVEVSFWNLREEELPLAKSEDEGKRRRTTSRTRWAADLLALEALITDRTRAIVINSPHNPTGFVFSEDELDRVIALCRAKGIYLFSDEVYAGIEHPWAQLPISGKACDRYEKAVSLGVLSKAQGLPGLRIGWAASRDRKLLEGMGAVKLYTSICAPAPSEHLAEIAVRQSKALCARNLGLIEANIAALDDLVEEFSDLLSWSRPSAGCIALLRLNADLGCTAEAFAIEAVTKAGVLLLPSEYFDFGERHIRIGFGRVNFKEKLKHFRDFLLTRRQGQVKCNE